ncbi:hypothetical protein T484DRAFT_1757323, partial [Baffinella frigidus]
MVSAPSSDGCVGTPCVGSEVVPAESCNVETYVSTTGEAKEAVTAADMVQGVEGDVFKDIHAPESSTLREDRNRELRAMLLSVHPCPPLPQVALGGLHMEARVFSSHDLLASSIERMLVNNDSVRNEARR